MLFGGISEHTLDPNGRVIIPRKMRFSLGETFVMTRGHGKCLYIFTQEQIGAIKTEVDRMGTVLSVLFDPKALRLSRQLFAEMENTDTDSQGRVLIPPRLREYAEISNAVVIVGAGDRIEIWNPDNWRAYAEQELTEEKLTGAGSDPEGRNAEVAGGDTEISQTGSAE
jgi:MraZ protein